MDGDEFFDWLVRGAKNIYDAEQSINPIMWLVVGDEIIGVGPPHGGHPLDALTPFLGVASRAFAKLTHIGLVLEAWSKSFKPEDRPNMPRGTLEALHEAGDTSVETVIIVQVWDVTDISHPHGAILKPPEGDEGWTDRREGADPMTEQDGYVNEHVARVYRQGREGRTEDPALTLAMDKLANLRGFLNACVHTKTITYAAVLTTDQSWGANLN